MTVLARDDATPGLQRRVEIAVAAAVPVLRDGLVEYLAHCDGCEVVGSALSVQREAELVAACQPEVLVLDSRLEDERGFEALRRGRELAPGLSIVLLTDERDAQAVDVAIGLGATALVTKSGPLRAVSEAIRAVSEGEMWVSPTFLPQILGTVRSHARVRPVEGRLATMTEREVEILRLLAAGLGEAEIGYRLFISVNTVRSHTRNIKRKLGVHSNLAAVSLAYEEGFPF